MPHGHDRPVQPQEDSGDGKDFVPQPVNKAPTTKIDHCKPDPTPAWRMILDFLTLAGVAVAAYAGFIQAGQAIKSTNIAGDTLRYSQRPYIGVEPTNIENFTVGVTTAVTFSITNFGQTPAYNSRAKSGAAVLPYPLPEDAPFPFPPDLHESFGSVATIFPHSPIPTGVAMSSPLTESEVRDVVNGEKRRLYAGGTVWFDDIFGLPHCYRYLFSIGGPEFIENLRKWQAGDRAAMSAWRQAPHYNDESGCEKEQ